MILVYAYGCGKPISGWQHARREQERCAALWDVLVSIERAQERQQLADAAMDVPRLELIANDIAQLSALLADTQDDKDARQQRRALYAEQRGLLNTWRKEHKPLLREYEKARQLAVKMARQQTDAFWGNYNRVLQAYESARQICRQTGRRLRPYDFERDDGVLMIQIQRTRSGLGAAPEELRDGTVSSLQISSTLMDRRHYQCSMRVDAQGNEVCFPVCLHRPLPEQCRIKSAQLVWRRQGGRVIYQLCLTVDTGYTPPVSDTIPIRIATLQLHPDAAPGQPLLSALFDGVLRTWKLPDTWWRRALIYRAQQQKLDEAIERGRAVFGSLSDLRANFAEPSYLCLFDQLQATWNALSPELQMWYRHTRRLWNAWTGLRQSLLGYRREMYRQIARELVALYPAFELPELDLSQLARTDRGTSPNSARHWLALHRLRLEILHQARKAGVPVLASGQVMNATKHRKSTAWLRRKDGKRAALANNLQDTELSGMKS